MSNTVLKLLKDATVGWFKKKGDNKSSGLSGWVTKLVMAIAVMSFLAYAAYTSNKRKKALAKALHERDVAEEEQHRAQVAWELSVKEEQIKKNMDILVEAKKKSEAFGERVKSLQETHAFELHKIEAIKNWDDMDRYLDSIR